MRETRTKMQLTSFEELIALNVIKTYQDKNFVDYMDFSRCDTTVQGVILNALKAINADPKLLGELETMKSLPGTEKFIKDCQHFIQEHQYIKNISIGVERNN